jgi:colicin import membrane protein
MKNSNISDFVAVAMDTVLKSDEHKSLFATQYKYASDEKDASCHVCKQSLCVCNKNKANDNDVKDSSDDYSSSSSDSSSSSSESDGSSSEDYDTKDHMDSSYADDDALQVSAAFDVAIDGLLTASAALDSIGLSNGSSLSLKLATLVVNAKKRDPAAVSSKAKKDSQMAKDKLAKEKAKKEKDMQSAKDKLAKEKAAKEKAAKEKAMVAKSSK